VRIGNPSFVRFNEARTRYPVSVVDKDDYPLKPGWNNKKLGGWVVKGKWKGMPIYAFTLEERATCPRTCAAWYSCYGNKMPFAKRMRWSSSMMHAVRRQLYLLSARHSLGFVVRLHVLGDFIDEHYATLWINWLKQFPAMHIFGYTAREWEWLHEYAKNNWDRFAIRYSGSTRDRSTFITSTPNQTNRAITCPAQTGKTDCCGTCALCWTSTRPINFLEH
jgi:hypothetical protein